MKNWSSTGDGIPLQSLSLCQYRYSIKNNEKSEDVLDSAKDLFELAEVNIPYLVVDYAHRIGRGQSSKE